MELYPVSINGNDLKVALADTPESRHAGLSGLEKLGPNRGMLFIFPEPVRMSMVMRGMSIPLCFLFLNEAWEVVHTGYREPGSIDPIYPPIPVVMVLELEEDAIAEFNINVGDIVDPGEFISSSLTGMEMYKDGGKFEVREGKVYEITEDDIKIDPTKAQILNTSGEVVANIATGTRIFSRQDTKDLIKKAKAGSTDLVDHMIGIIDKQNKQKKKYVKERV